MWLGEVDTLLFGVVEAGWLVRNVKGEMHGDEKTGPLVEKSHNCQIMEEINFSFATVT